MDAVDIVNSALVKIGESRIVSLDDESKPARIAKITYPERRDVLLQGHPWNFAIARASLTADVTVPAWGFTKHYPFPEGATPPYCLRVLEVNGQDEGSGLWKVEGRAIVTSVSSPITIRYVSRVENAGLMTPAFREALATDLARLWAEPIAARPDLKADLERETARALADARSMDGQEGMPEQVSDCTWITARE